METFSHYKIVTNEHGSTLILYLNQNQTEFGREFLESSKENLLTLQQKIKHFIDQKVPNAKVNSVKVMLGTSLIFSIPISQVKAHDINYNMTYMYFGTTSLYIESIDKTKGSLSVVSPSFFDLHEDGSLKLSNQLDLKLITEMHARGLQVVPFLSNHWDRDVGNAALANRKQLANDIANAIEYYNLDGINVDIENVNELQRDNYTDFVRLLREKIPAHKEVSVAVAANPNGWQKGWHGSYDYRNLAAYSDHLLIMAYDEHYQGGSEGPVASIEWVEKSIIYALNQGVPNEKIVLGIPFFGRYWIEGEPSGGLGISNYRVEQLLSFYGGKVIYDDKAQSPKATITIKPNDPKFTISGKALSPGVYHIWYENDQSIQKKISLVHKYNLKGTGSWSLRQENPTIWNSYSQWTSSHEDFNLPPQINEEDIRYYIQHKVQNGDSLYRIAEKYGSTHEAIMQKNYLASEYIYEGRTLNIPVLKSAKVTYAHIPNIKLPANHSEPIARLHVRHEVPLLKRDSSGNYLFYKMLKRDEFYRTYGVRDQFYDVGGGYYVFADNNRTSVYIGRILVEKNTPLYRPDGSIHRTVKRGEAIRVYSYDNNVFQVGGGYYMKKNNSVKYYIGHVFINESVPLYDPSGKVYKILPKSTIFRAYNIDGAKIDLGGGYYVLNNSNKVRFSKN